MLDVVAWVVETRWLDVDFTEPSVDPVRVVVGRDAVEVPVEPLGVDAVDDDSPAVNMDVEERVEFLVVDAVSVDRAVVVMAGSTDKT